MTDEEFWRRTVDDAAWLLYGDLDQHFAAFVAKVFSRGFSDWALSPRHLNGETAEFEVAYWLFVSELVRLDLLEYGTSPRGAWWTEDGARFKRIYGERAARMANPFERDAE